MGAKGLELVEAFPRSLPEDIYNRLIIKCMPLGAKDGEFTTTQVEDYFFSGYVFSIPQKGSRPNIASLAAIFDESISNPISIKKVFAYTINELSRNNMVNVETLTGILPNLYKGINDGHLKIKISSVVTLEFDFVEDKKENPVDETLRDLRKDMWSK